jgi:hypothetical protein
LVRHLEPTQLVEERQLVAEELQQLVGVANALASGHEGRLHTFVQSLEALVAAGAPDFLKGKVDGVILVGLVVLVTVLDFGEAEECLESCIYPAGATLIAKSKGGCHLTS